MNIKSNRLACLISVLVVSQLLFPYTQSSHSSVDQVQSTNLGLTSSNGYVNVNVSEAKQMIESNPNLVILDVRTQEAYNEGHIGNAVLIPVSELESRLDELDMEDEILVYCRSGVRSATASQILVDNGFTSIYNMLGGITAWRNEGYWIEIIHEGDLVIDGTQTYTIENCRYLVVGNIYVKDWGKLATKNIVLLITGQHEEFYTTDSGELTMENTAISLEFARGPLRFFTSGNAQVDFINVTIDAWMHSFEDSRINILNSTLSEIQVTDRSIVSITQSVVWRLGLEFFLSSQVAYLEQLRPGFYKRWNLHQNSSVLNVPYDLTVENTLVNSWTVGMSVGMGNDPTATISNSEIEEIGYAFYNTNIRLSGARLGFHRNWTVNTVTLLNTSVVGFWHLWIDNSFGDISNTTARIGLVGHANVSIRDSTIALSAIDLTNGVIQFHDIKIEGIGIQFSSFYVCGEVDFPSEIDWLYTNATRNYNIITRDMSGNTMENVELTLHYQNDTVMWNGITDSLGKADFNVTFTDNNYTDTLRLEAVKGGYSATMNVSFLCDTPVVLTMRYFADLNADGTINILDISLLAMAFGSTPEDPNWNQIVDLNNDEIINILDISTVAMEFGKTV